MRRRNDVLTMLVGPESDLLWIILPMSLKFTRTYTKLDTVFPSVINGALMKK